MTQTFHPNPLRLADSYKNTHIYDDSVSELLSYFEARGGEFPYTNFFGLQGLLMETFTEQFFTQRDLDEEYENSQEHFGKFPYRYNDWQHILRVHGGRLPVEIKAVREGSIVPVSNVLFTVRSTDPRVPWVGQWMETVLQHVWYTTCVATKSRIAKELYKDYLLKTADSLAALPFQLHDFGFRGTSGIQEAARGGAAHLINFLGTDTPVAMDYLNQYYGAAKVSGFSVPASEHSVMTLKGEGGEAGQVEALLNKYPTGILSIVGDSYDIFNFTDNIIGGQFRDRIRARVGKVVIRPDSGDPVKQVPVLLNMLGDKFGYTENSKGYRVLPPVVGLLWGDGMDYYTIKDQLAAIQAARWSTENIVNGMGGGLLRKVNRDTQKCAIKLCNAVIDGESTPVFKNPVTDKGKASKKGRLALLRDEIGYRTVQDVSGTFEPFDQLEQVFLNGRLTRFQKLDEIRKNAEVV
jgi:nicotinamide phosphoribosyltransferase